MKQLLQAKGWKTYYSCQCSGTLKEYYNSADFPGYEITIRPRKHTFKIVYKNQTVAGPSWGYQLEQKMREHGISDKA